MALLFLTIGFFALAMLVMSIGVIVSGRCLRGSCGGPPILDSAGAPITCVTCPNRQRLIRQAQVAAKTASLP